MEERRINLLKGEYTDFSETFEKHDILILNGARGSGKSYPVAKYISKYLLENKESRFVYTRINNKELATFDGWCNDLDLHALSDYSESYKLTRGKPTRGDILLTGFDEKGAIVYERVIGKCMSLESSAEFKSGKYDEYFACVFEEYTHLKMNPENEKRYVFNFLENIETIFRDREKKIFLICNNFKNIPLLDQAIDELTGEKFKHPIKIRIYRKDKSTHLSPFMAYLNGELYDDDDFIVNIDEFFIVYTNKNFIVRRHKFYAKKYYIQNNKNNRKIIYREVEYALLSNFCKMSGANEFYYQNEGVAKTFTLKYSELLREIAKFVSDHGSKYIMP